MFNKMSLPESSDKTEQTEKTEEIDRSDRLPEIQRPQYQRPQYQRPQYQRPQYQRPQYQRPQYDNSDSSSTLTTLSSSITKYYDKHTLHVKSGVAYDSQLTESLTLALQEAERILGRKLDSEFKVNIIVGRNGKLYGLGYIWVNSEEVYNTLIGKNPDGTERYESILDPNWKKPDIDYDEAMEKIEEKYLSSWADFSEAEEELDKQYSPQYIKIQLPPIVQLPGYNYDVDQLEHVKSLAIDKVLAPTKGYFHISPAYVEDLEEKYCPHILCSRDVPTWIKEEHIKHAFTPYASDSHTIINRKIRGTKFTDTYPFVTINENRVAFVTFDSKTHDAQFALLMMRKVVFTKIHKPSSQFSQQSSQQSSQQPPENTENKEQQLLIFTHSFNVYSP